MTAVTHGSSAPPKFPSSNPAFEPCHSYAFNIERDDSLRSIIHNRVVIVAVAMQRLSFIRSVGCADSRDANDIDKDRER